MPNPPKGASQKPFVVAAKTDTPSLKTSTVQPQLRNNDTPDALPGLAPGPAEAGPPIAIAVRLLRYIVHKEDDGVGGAGVDLYLGYVTSSLVTQGNFAVDIPSRSGTTPVAGGLTDSNGHNPRNRHDVNQELFTVKVPAGGELGASLRLLESDDSTAEVVRAYANGWARDLGSREAVPMDSTQIASYFAGPIAAITNILKASNSDDDYGHWFLSFSQSGGKVTVHVRDGDAHCSSSVLSVTVPTEVTLKYLDSENEIDAVIGVTLF